MAVPDTDQRSGPGLDPLVDVVDLSFSYENGTQALGGISFSLERGKRLGVVGPSGCGKSTLLSLLAELSRPSGGTIDWRASGGGAHPLAMVFQKDTLLPWMTVSQNVALYSKFQKVTRSEARKRVEELLPLVSLEGASGLYPYQLSGGMRRRVAFLAAVAPSPQVLLLDEPFSSLDEPTRVGIHQDVLRIGAEMNMTMVLVTHDLAEAISLCDEVLILTQRPATVASRHQVPFGREREVLELRQDPDFLELYGTLWHELSQQILAGKRDAAAEPEDTPAGTAS